MPTLHAAAGKAVAGTWIARRPSHRSLPAHTVALAALVVAALAPATTTIAPRAAQAQIAMSRLVSAPVTLAFDPNRGQAGSGIDYVARGQGFGVSLQPTGALLTIAGTEGATSLRMTLIGSNPGARSAAEDRLAGTVGYAGAGMTRAALDSIPTYAAVRYTAVYPGVDVVYYGREGRLEYDFRLSAGADARPIRLAFSGADRPALAANGDLILVSGRTVVRQPRPVIYQIVGGVRRAVSGGYTLTGGTVGFRTGTYDHRLPLVIDPVLAYSTYFGGKGDDSANGIAMDDQGNVYLAGTTAGSGQKTMAFLAKLDPSGRHVLYTRYISNIYSNAKTACNSTGTGVAVDGHGNAYITGAYGYEDQFNLCNNQAVLWARVDTAGRIDVKIYGKYGGSKGKAIAIDRQGNTYVTGSTDQWEANFPATQGAFQTKPGIDKAEDGLAGDAFVLKIDPSGNVIYGTFLGGSTIDDGNAIAVDAQGQAYVVGTTTSVNFPLTGGAFQRQRHNPFAAAFLSKLSADGSTLLYSTFLSGNNGEDLSGVAVDSRGDAYVVGSSDSSDFPTTPGAYKRTCGGDGMCDPNKTWYTDYGSNTNYWHINVAEDVVFAVFDTTQSGAASLRYSTFIGGFGRDLGLGIALDRNGRAYLTGRTAAPDYPGARAGAGRSFDAFLTVIDPRRSGAASLVASATFGSGADDAGQAIAVDRQGDVCMTGYTNGRDFPTHAALQSADAGGYDAFIIKIGGLAAHA